MVFVPLRHPVLLLAALLIGLPQNVAVAPPPGAVPIFPRLSDSGGSDDPCAGATIKGTSGNDRLTGTDGDDVIAAGGGDDRVDGGGGNDVICGGAGDDTLIGGAGDDRLYGDAGADNLRGGTGRDSLDGGSSVKGGQGGGFVMGGGDRHASLHKSHKAHKKSKSHEIQRKHHRGGHERPTKPTKPGPPQGPQDRDVCASGETYTGCEQKIADPGYNTTKIGSRGATAAVHGDDRVSRFDLDISTDYIYSQVALDGRVSYTYNLTADQPFRYADITFPYSQAATTFDGPTTPTTPPRISLYRYDTDAGLWVRAPGTPTVNEAAGTVTARVTRPARYAAFREIPDSPPFSSYWASKPRWCAAPGEPTPDFAAALVVGTGAGMATSDPAGSRAEAAKQFVDAMRPADQLAVIGYNDTATVESAFGAVDAAAAKAALDRTRTATGGNDLGVAVHAGIDQLVQAVDEGRPRIAVLVSDGPGPIADTDVDAAVDSDVVFYTVSVGGGDTGQLRNIARETGGRFFPLTDAGQLAGVYRELRQDLTDPGTDTDRDRVTDCVERRGALVAHGFYGDDQPFHSGRYARTDPNDSDTDNDTLTDGDELGPVHDITLDPDLAATYPFLTAAGVKRFYNPSSNPNREDSEGEGLSDPDERRFGTNPFVADTDGDGSTDAEEVRAGLTSPTERNDWIWAGRGDDGIPENVPGLAPLTLVKPDTNEFPWDFDVLSWSPDTGDCSAECLAVNDWAQQKFGEQGWFCKLMTSCQPDDLRQEWIEQAVDVQGLFTYDEGFMRQDYVESFVAYNCQRFAVRGEECFSETVEDKADDDYNYQDLGQALQEILANIPGGSRPPDPEVDEATGKLDKLAKQACREVQRLPGETPTAYGSRVHQRFEELINQLGDPKLFGETGYRNGQVVDRIPGQNGEPPRWPNDTTAPDAVFGESRNAPRAAYDLKTGEKAIQPKWIKAFLNNLRGLVPFGSTVELIELTC